MNKIDDSSQSALPLDQKFKNRIIAPNEIINLSILKFMVKNEYYQTMDDFQKDVISLFENISNSNNFDADDSSRISSIFIEFQNILLDSKRNFEKLYIEDINKMMENNYLPKCPESI